MSFLFQINLTRLSNYLARGSNCFQHLHIILSFQFIFFQIPINFEWAYGLHWEMLHECRFEKWSPDVKLWTNQTGRETFSKFNFLKTSLAWKKRCPELIVVEIIQNWLAVMWINRRWMFENHKYKCFRYILSM